MVGAALTAVGLAGQIFSAFRGGKMQKENRELLGNMKAENEAFYNNNVNRDFMQTNAAKGIFEQLRKRNLDANKLVDSQTEATGGTAEAAIAMKGQNNEQYNDAVNELGQNATQYQTNQEAMYRATNNQLAGQEMAMNEAEAESAANLATNSANLMSAAANIPGDKSSSLLPGYREPFRVPTIKSIAAPAFKPVIDTKTLAVRR
jgi:hypothetical protein